MKSLAPEIAQRLNEQLRHTIFELEERLGREERYHEELQLKYRLVERLCSRAETLEEIDAWEFESQVLSAQTRQSQQEITFLERDLQMQRVLLHQLETEFPPQS